MKHFWKPNQITQIIWSVLLGLMVTDHDRLDRLFGAFLHGNSSRDAGFWAWFVSSSLFLIFLHNIYGSVRFDQWADKTGYIPSLAQSLRGRIELSGLLVATLIINPFLTDHMLAHHVYGAPMWHHQGWWTMFFLYLPLTPFAVWDLTLWWTEVDATPHKYHNLPQIQQISLAWLKVDAVTLLLAMSGIVCFLYLHRTAPTAARESLCYLFAISAVVNVFGNFLLDPRLYFMPD